ncbi:Cys-tRNA(Pro) deacylase [Nocardia zapadnayensis]|uniref:Cys-tRNA(Pro)/Cys-tRNA(Cys) deacylase n=1 Tax=Brevibacterium pityocampae TaxID=506594 RepID=A0ABP8J3P1_9MICO|nr:MULTISPECIES: Cys-tRNA(Pro) deacylase [Actinomycetes]MCK1801813.1 Cys-tRNA(Pro) deacylase [Brevibacterium sp. R8603A2]MCX0277946.1 Cys-tRNA(Pro) deacylase [Nocardia zapadnayensis]
MSIAARIHSSATPALRVLNLAGVEYSVHEFDHDPAVRRYGPEAVEQLGTDSARVFKTLMILVDAEPVIALVPVSGQLDLKALAGVLGGKKAHLAGIAETERRTGYVAGGVSPFGQRNASPVVLDRTAQDFSTVFVSAGRRGMEIEIRPDDLVMLTNARIGKIANLD